MLESQRMRAKPIWTQIYFSVQSVFPCFIFSWLRKHPRIAANHKRLFKRSLSGA